MINEFHKKAIARITPEKRACLVKSLEVISQIHSILDRKDISQKALAGMLNVSPASVSKMLNPGSNLELFSIAKLEVLLGETIITTPQMVETAPVPPSGKKTYSAHLPKNLVASEPISVYSKRKTRKGKYGNKKTD